MATPPEDFPEIAHKLKVPLKRSAYEREKAEREAKRRRDEALNAAALKEFEESMQAGESPPKHGDDDKAFSNSFAPQRTRYVPAGGKRHYAAAMPNSGPGTLEGFGRKSGPGTLPGTFDPPSRKRTFDEATQPSEARSSPDVDDDDDAEEKARAQAHRPALRVANLPPHTPRSAVKSLIPEKFGNTEVAMDAPNAPRTGERKSCGMIVTFPVGTPSNEVDSLVSSLNRKYMGKGYYLHVSRYLKTPSLNQQLPGSLDRNRVVQPFGARLIQDIMPGAGRGRFAPPNSYHQSNKLSDAKQYEVVVQIPELNQLKMINKTIERVIEGGPEFEYCLMNDEDIIHDEKWAFLWDSTSVAGIYYRYRLWDIASGHCSRNLGTGKDSQPVEIFAGNARWVPPKELPPFEFATSSEDFAAVYDYDASSDDELDDEDGGRRFNRSRAPEQGTLVIQEEYLNPLDKYRLIWLLAGLPTSTANLIRSDVAAVMDFAISHANRGADEIVDILVTNVERPYCFTSANEQWKKPEAGLSDHPGLGVHEDELDKSGGDASGEHVSRKEDDSAARMIGLYCISDVISAARNANIPGVWRYRELFRKVLLERKVFSKLGRLDRDLQWGRLKSEIWKRSVTQLLDFWLQCGACLASEHEQLVHDFVNPVLTEEEKLAAEKKAKEDAEHKLAVEKKAKEEAEHKQAEMVKQKQAALMKRVQLMKEQAEKAKKEVQSPDVSDEQAKGSPDAMDIDKAEQPSAGLQESGKSSESKLDLPPKMPAPAQGSGEFPGETAAARAKRNRVKAEDLFDSPGEEVDMFQFDG
jgi:U2-associated protein SR140